MPAFCSRGIEFVHVQIPNVSRLKNAFPLGKYIVFMAKTPILFRLKYCGFIVS